LSEVEQLDESMHEFAFEIALSSLQKQVPLPAQLLLVKAVMHEVAQDGQFAQGGPQAKTPVDEASTRSDASEDLIMWCGLQVVVGFCS
jgi:hypothetical protein